MEEEIIAAGINQALKRGESLQKAMQTFINAGYPREAVERAVKLVNSTQEQGLYNPIMPQTRPGMQVPSMQPTQAPQRPLPGAMPKVNKQQTQQPLQMQGQDQGQNQQVRVKRGHGSFKLWLIVILVVIATVAINGFLLWKFILK